MQKSLNIETYLKQAVESYVRKHGKINISKFAKYCDVPYSSAYQAIKGDRRVNVDTWFKIMEGLGAAKNAKGKIVIDKAI